MEEDAELSVADMYPTQCENEGCRNVYENLQLLVQNQQNFARQQNIIDTLTQEKQVLVYKLTELDRTAADYYRKCEIAVNDKELAEADLERVRQDCDFYKRRMEDLSSKAADSEVHLKNANDWRTKYDEMSQLAEQLEAKLDEIQTQYVKTVSLLDQCQKKYTTVKAKLEADKTKYDPIMARQNILNKYLKKAITLIDTLSCSANVPKKQKSTKDLIDLFRRDDVRVQFNAEPWRRSAVNSTAKDLGLHMSDDEEDGEEEVAEEDVETLEQLLDKSSDVDGTIVEINEKKGRARKFIPVENLNVWPKGIKKPLPETAKGTSADHGIFNPRLVHAKRIPVQIAHRTTDFDALNNAASQRTKALLDRGAGPSSSTSSLPSVGEPAATTIHGRKGKTIREQQAENMLKMSIKEKVEKMKEAEKMEEGGPSTSTIKPATKPQPARKTAPRNTSFTLSEASEISPDDFEIPEDIQIPLSSSSDLALSVSESVKLRGRHSSVYGATSSSAPITRSRSSSRGPVTRTRSQSVVSSASSENGRPKYLRSMTSTPKKPMSSPRNPKLTSEVTNKPTDRLSRAQSRATVPKRSASTMPKMINKKIEALPEPQRRSTRIMSTPDRLQEREQMPSRNDRVEEEIETTEISQGFRRKLRSFSVFATPSKESSPIEKKSGLPTLSRNISSKSRTESVDEIEDISKIKELKPKLTKKSSPNDEQTRGLPELLPNKRYTRSMNSALAEEGGSNIDEEKKKAVVKKTFTVEKDEVNAGPPTRVKCMPVKPTSSKKMTAKATPELVLRKSTRLEKVLPTGEDSREENSRKDARKRSETSTNEGSISTIPDSEKMSEVNHLSEELPVPRTRKSPRISRNSSLENEEDDLLRIDEPEEEPITSIRHGIEKESTKKTEKECRIAEELEEEKEEEDAHIDDGSIPEFQSKKTITSSKVVPKVRKSITTEPMVPRPSVKAVKTSCSVSHKKDTPEEAMPTVEKTKVTKSVARSSVKVDVTSSPISDKKSPVKKSTKDQTTLMQKEEKASVKTAIVNHPNEEVLPTLNEPEEENVLMIDEPSSSSQKTSTVEENPTTSQVKVKASHPNVKTTARHIALGLDISDSEDEEDSATTSTIPPVATQKSNNEKRTAILIDVPVKKSGRGVKRESAKPTGLKDAKRVKLSKSSIGSTVLRQALDLKLPVSELTRPLEEKGFTLVDGHIAIETEDAVNVMIEYLKQTSHPDMWTVLLRHKKEGNTQPLVNNDEENFLNVSYSLVADGSMLLRLFIERIIFEFATHDNSMSPTLCGCFTRLLCHAVRFVHTEEEEEKQDWMRQLMHVMFLRHENQAIRTLAYCLISISAEHLEWISDEIANGTFFSKILRLFTWNDKHLAEVVNWLISAKFANRSLILNVVEEEVRDVIVRMLDDFLLLKIEFNDNDEAYVASSVLARKSLTQITKTGDSAILDVVFGKMKEQMEELENKLLNDEDGRKKPHTLFGSTADDKISASQASTIFLKFEWISNALLVFISNPNYDHCRAIMNALSTISPQIVKFKQVLSSESSDKFDQSAHKLLQQSIQKMANLVAEFTRYPLEKSVLKVNL